MRIVARRWYTASPTAVRAAFGCFRALLAPRERLLPALGARSGAYPRIAAFLVSAPRWLPGAWLRATAYRNVSRPFLGRMKARLVVRVNGGGRMRVDTADVTGRTIAVTGAWEPHVTDVFSRLLLPGDVCIDVGAHVGYYTLLASRLVGPHGHVYAIEPASTTYAELRRNLALNRVSNVTALNLAAGAADGRGILYDGPPGNAGQASMQEPVNMSGDPSARGSEVQVRRVVSVIAPDHHLRVRLVKIDVEGFEFDVLRGLEPLLYAGAHPAVLMELHPALWAGRDPIFFEEFCARHSLEVVPLFERDRPMPVRLRDARTFRVDLLDARQDVLLAPKGVAHLNRGSAAHPGSRRSE